MRNRSLSLVCATSVLIPISSHMIISPICFQEVSIVRMANRDGGEDLFERMVERAELEALSRRRKTSQGLARRARIVLAAAEGLENKEIAVRLEASADTVGKWRRRYAAEGLDGLYDEMGRPGAPFKSAMTPSRKRSGTLEETPPELT